MARAPETSNEQKKRGPSSSYLKYSALALQFVLVIALLGWLGFRLDAWLSLKFPAFLLLFSTIGLVGMIYRLYRSVNP